VLCYILQQVEQVSRNCTVFRRFYNFLHVAPHEARFSGEKIVTFERKSSNFFKERIKMIKRLAPFYRVPILLTLYVTLLNVTTEELFENTFAFLLNIC